MVFTSGEEITLEDEQGLPRMVPAFDPALEDFVERHGHGLDDIRGMQIIQVYDIDQKTWESIDVVTKIKGELHKETQEWYEDRDTYREGAIECYNEHGNPDLASGCPDFMDDSKRIGRAQYKDDSGNVHNIPQKFRQYLCYQCPFMHAYVQVEIRRKKGMYKAS
jgi:hypothetical protein